MDPGEIVVFQDRQGKLKTSNVSLDDILIRRRDVVENTIALYSNDGKLKPGAVVSTITEKLITVDNTANSLKSLNDEFIKFIQPLQECLGVSPVTTPNIATIKNRNRQFSKIAF